MKMESSRQKKSPIMLSVMLDRCGNRYWRFFHFLFLGACTITLICCWHSMFDKKDLVGEDWKAHWMKKPRNLTVPPASRTFYEVETKNNVVEKQQSLEDKANSPVGEDSDYYDSDHVDVNKNRFWKKDYLYKYKQDMKIWKEKRVDASEMGVSPDRKDYSKQPNFQKLFRTAPEEKISFASEYRNPCWAESIPKYPYQSNSYLKVSHQVSILEPQFQIMRRVFASRQDPLTKWRLRCLPYFYVMETPPLSAIRLYSLLGFHPSIANPQLAEPEFWNEKGPDMQANLGDYLDLFDAAAEKIRSDATMVTREEDGTKREWHDKITGDGTSSYLWTMNNWRLLPGNSDLTEPMITTANLIKDITPQAKIIMMLRNPADRLFQGYLSRTPKGNASASDFHDRAGHAMQAMSNCIKKYSLRTCLYDSTFNKRLSVRVRIGMYYPFIQDWIKVFTKDQILVLRYEDYITSPSQTVSEVLRFLELAPFSLADMETFEKQIKALETKRVVEQEIQMMSMTRAMLSNFYKDLNKELASLLNDDKFTWPGMDRVNVDQMMAQSGVRKRNVEQAKQEVNMESIDEDSEHSSTLKETTTTLAPETKMNMEQPVQQQPRQQQTMQQQPVEQQPVQQQWVQQQPMQQQPMQQQPMQQQPMQQPVEQQPMQQPPMQQPPMQQQPVEQQPMQQQPARQKLAQQQPLKQPSLWRYKQKYVIQQPAPDQEDRVQQI